MEYCDNEIINLYLNGSSMMEISKLCGYKSDRQIRNILKTNNISSRSSAGSKNMHLNHNYFENIDTEYKAYFLGLMLSDGCVSDRHNNRQSSIQLKFEKTDEYILEILKKELNTTNKITTKDINYRSLVVHSNKMACDLNKLYVSTNKTFKCRLPMLENKLLMRHLIRGVIDGDGWICKINSTEKFVIGVCGASQIVFDIMQYLNEELNLPILKIKDSGNNKCKHANIERDLSKFLVTHRG